MNLEDQILTIGRQARTAARALARLDAKRKNACLEAMACGLESHSASIREANARDLEKGRKAGLSNAMLDRLLIDAKRLEGMVKAVRTLIGFKDPVGQVLLIFIQA